MFYKPVEKNTRGSTVSYPDRQVVRGITEAKNVFDAFHNSLMGGYTGTTKTCTAIVARFYWPGIWQDTKKWVRFKFNKCLLIITLFVT